MNKSHFRFQNFICAMLLAAFGMFLACHFFSQDGNAYADDGTPIRSVSEEFFVTIYDNGQVLTVKTAPASVREVLSRSNISISETDIVEPSLDTVIEEDYNINIYHARPVVVIDGSVRQFVMTASFDPSQIAREAGFTIYDGDEVAAEPSQGFLETGVVSTFRISHHGGSTLTETEPIAYEKQTRYDYNLEKGSTYLERAGEEGRRIRVYEVQFENGQEVSREVVSETIQQEPVSEIVVVGAKVAVPPEQAECAGWATAAGVSPENLETALTLIYHESGCRVDATNASSGAYGIPQALPGEKMAAFGDDWQTNPVTQIRWMEQYVTGRYGGWSEAMAWWWEHGWY